MIGRLNGSTKRSYSAIFTFSMKCASRFRRGWGWYLQKKENKNIAPCIQGSSMQPLRHLLLWPWTGWWCASDDPTSLLSFNSLCDHKKGRIFGRIFHNGHGEKLFVIVIMTMMAILNKYLCTLVQECELHSFSAMNQYGNALPYHHFFLLQKTIHVVSFDKSLSDLAVSSAWFAQEKHATYLHMPHKVQIC